MNKRTAKLLKEYARNTDKSERAVKKWWNTLSPTERTKQRQLLSAELNQEIEEAEVVEEVTAE